MFSIQYRATKSSNLLDAGINLRKVAKHLP